MEHANPARLIGLGQAPSDAVAGQLFQTSFTQVPVAEYVTWTVETPLLNSTIQSVFGDEIDILQSPKQVAGVSSVDSSFVLNGVLQTDMLCIGFGCHIFAEPQTFTQIGNVLSPAPGLSTATIVSPDVFTLNDVSELGAPEGGTVTPAILRWGTDSWQAAWHLAQAYQFEWLMAQRHLVIDELVADVSYFGPYADAVASGTSETDVQEYARRINDRYRDIGGGGIFVPVNARRVGSVNTNTLSGSKPNAGVFHPTRDFDLAPVTYGGIRNQGAAGCCQPFRKLCKPVLVEKGIPVGMQLRVQDAYHQAQMQEYLSISDAAIGGGGTLANVKLDAFDTGTSVLSATVSGIYELTLDPGASNSFALQQVSTTRIEMKGGVFKLAILLKGYEVWGKWREWMLTNWGDLISSPTAAQLAGPPGYNR